MLAGSSMQASVQRSLTPRTQPGHVRNGEARQSSTQAVRNHRRGQQVLCDAASDNGVGTSGRSEPPAKPFVVKFFDSANPEHVVEVPLVPPKAQPSTAAGSNGSSTTALTLSGTDAGALVPNAKDIALQKALVQQLGEERVKVAQLQQYELMYRETRMNSERLKGEVVALQDMVSRKDAELARSYGAMSESAAERATLRKQYTTSQESVSKLHAQLEEARSVVAQLRAMLPPGKYNGTGAAALGSGSSASSSGTNGSSSSSSDFEVKVGQLAGAPAASSSSPQMSAKGVAAVGGRDSSSGQYALGSSPSPTSTPQPLSVLSVS